MTSQISLQISALFTTVCELLLTRLQCIFLYNSTHATFSPELYLHLVSFHYTSMLSGRSAYNKFLFIKTKPSFTLSFIPALTFTFKSSPFIALAPQYLLSRCLTSSGNVLLTFSPSLFAPSYISATNYTILTVKLYKYTNVWPPDRMAPLVSGLFL